MGDQWAAGRKKHWQNVLDGKSQYWGFDYRKIFDLLVSVHENDYKIEKEDNEAYLRQYVSENQPRAIGRFEKAESFQEKVRYAFYARLTVLWRCRDNWLKKIPMDFHGSFAQMFDFWLKGYGQESIRGEEVAWIKGRERVKTSATGSSG